MRKKTISILPDWPAIDPSGENLGIQDFLTFKLTVVLNVLNSKVTKRYFDYTVPITLPAWRILGLLDLHGSLSAKSLHDLSQMDNAQITRGVTELIAKSLVSRSPASGHATRRMLALTDSGRSLYLEILQRARPLHAEVLLSLTDDERKSFNDSLGKVLSAAARIEYR